MPSFARDRARPPSDLTLFSCACPGRAAATSEVMLAKVHRDDALLELLTPHAWASALGYAPAELGGRSLGDLLQAGRAGGAAIVSALLDEDDLQPIDVTVVGGDARGRHLRLYRRFDAYAGLMFILADEVSAGSVAPRGRGERYDDEQTAAAVPSTIICNGRLPAGPEASAA